MYYQGKKFVTYLFIDKRCSIMSKCCYIYCSGTLLDHLRFNPDFKMVTLSFLAFTQILVIQNENSQNLLGNSMTNSQILWVVIKNTKHRIQKDNKICVDFSII